MNKPFDINRQFLLPACIGAALSYGVIYLTNDDANQHEQIVALQNHILELEQSLAQKEDELADAHLFSAGAFASPASTNTAPASTANKSPSATTNTRTEQASSNQAISDAAHDSQQLLKDLSTRSDRDPRSFSDKANELLSAAANKEGIAIVSKGIFELADNRELLPDYELESLYQSQSNPDVKRVAAQVMATRGDNRLLEKQIAATQVQLASDNPDVRQQALVELGKTRYASAANAITPLLQDANNSVKLDALLALRATGNQSHLRAVEALVNDPDPAVSWLAKDVASNLQNLSEKARTQLANADIVAELPVITAP